MVDRECTDFRWWRVVCASATTLVVVVALLVLIKPPDAFAADGDFLGATGAECRIHREVLSGPDNQYVRCNYGGSDINDIFLYANVTVITSLATCSPDSGGMICLGTGSFLTTAEANLGTFQVMGLFDGAASCTGGRTTLTGSPPRCYYPQPAVGWRAIYCGASDACYNGETYPDAFAPEDMVCVDPGDCTAPTTTTSTTTSTTTTTIPPTPPGGGLTGHECDGELVLSITEMIHVIQSTASTLDLGDIRDEDVAWMIAIAIGESGLNIGATGDGGDSHGLWQINSPAHPSYDPELLESDPYYNAQAMFEISGVWEEYGYDDNIAVYHAWTVYWSNDGGVTDDGDGEGLASGWYDEVYGIVAFASGDDPGCGGLTSGGSEDCGNFLAHPVCNIKKAIREIAVVLFVPSDDSVDGLKTNLTAFSHKAPVSFVTEVVDSGSSLSSMSGNIAAHRGDCVEFYDAGGFGEDALELCFEEEADGLVSEETRAIMGVGVYFSALLAFGFGAVRKVNASG